MLPQWWQLDDAFDLQIAFTAYRITFPLKLDDNLIACLRMLLSQLAQWLSSSFKRMTKVVRYFCHNKIMTRPPIVSTPSTGSDFRSNRTLAGSRKATTHVAFVSFREADRITRGRASAADLARRLIESLPGSPKANRQRQPEFRQFASRFECRGPDGKLHGASSAQTVRPCLVHRTSRIRERHA